MARAGLSGGGFATAQGKMRRRNSCFVVCCTPGGGGGGGGADAGEVARCRLESAQRRVRVLNSRVVVRAGEAGIRAVESGVDVEELEKLRGEVRVLRGLGDVGEEAQGVVDRFDRVVSEFDLHTEGEEEAEDSFEEHWEAEEVEGVVGAVRSKVIKSGDELKRRVSGVGAGIEEKVSEFFRDDGSIDVDGLRGAVGSALDNASMTWQRLNGAVPQATAKGDAEGGTDVPVATLSLRDPVKEFFLQEQIGELEKKLNDASRARESMLRKEDQLGKLIRAKEIRAMDDGVSVLRRTLAVRVLQLEMEKIYVSLADEIEGSEYEMMMDQRVLVVEFGDLDHRLAELEVFIEQGEPILIEDDTLGELAADIQYLKTRLGLDTPLYSSARLDWPQMRQFATSSAKKARQGAEFYTRGLRLFVGDARFALRLIRRAVLGYTPSPREIRTLRRTGRDFLTLIPFTIVLIAPLTPIGHVLIFSFLQRYWPEFFPSTFSERRQTLMKRHEEYAKSITPASGSERDATPAAEVEEVRGLGRLRKLLFFGAMAAETLEIPTNDEVPSSAGSLRANASVEQEQDSSSDSNGDSNGLGSSEDSGVSESNASQSSGLEDLAESATDSELLARRKNGNSIALDDLHLAD